MSYAPQEKRCLRRDAAPMLLVLLTLPVGCGGAQAHDTALAQQPDPPEAQSERKSPSTRAPDQTEPWTPPAPVPLARPLATVPVSPGDPMGGAFNLDQATEGLSGEGQLRATLHTSQGVIVCELWPERAPLTVSNFVGLARGTRPWFDSQSGQWQSKPYYDGTHFHRVIPGFMVQSGMRSDQESPGPGYVIPDEIWEGVQHNEPGLLCMANRGPDTGGAQFFIVDDPIDKNLWYLDASHTVFGKCTPTEIVHEIATVEARGTTPLHPPVLTHIAIDRRVPKL